jgi:hypothetical protein
MVGSGVNATLVQQNDTSSLSVGLKSAHSIADVRGGQEMLLVLDGNLGGLSVINLHNTQRR